jgi:hypothetical protein
MGACTFRNSTTAKSMQDAYRNLVEDAVSEYGSDSYNGTISTTDGYEDLTLKFESSKKDLSAFIEEMLDKSSKRDCFGICTEKPKTNTNKIKSQVEHNVVKGTRKWELWFIVTEWDREIGKFKTKTEALKCARKHTETTQRTTRIHMEKRIVGDATTATIKYKQSTGEKPGRYVFFGWAAE